MPAGSERIILIVDYCCEVVVSAFQLLLIIIVMVAVSAYLVCIDAIINCTLQVIKGIVCTGPQHHRRHLQPCHVSEGMHRLCPSALTVAQGPRVRYH